MGEKSSQFWLENPATSKTGYTRFPDSVLMDTELSPSAKCVYAFLARHVHQGRVAKFGQRLIGRRMAVDRGTVKQAILDLEARGHLTVVGSGRQRNSYVLASDVFGQRQGKENIVQWVDGRKRLVSVETR